MNDDYPNDRVLLSRTTWARGLDVVPLAAIIWLTTVAGGVLTVVFLVRPDDGGGTRPDPTSHSPRR